jgi:hypothetical protein
VTLHSGALGGATASRAVLSTAAEVKIVAIPVVSRQSSSCARLVASKVVHALFHSCRVPGFQLAGMRGVPLAVSTDGG